MNCFVSPFTTLSDLSFSSLLVPLTGLIWLRIVTSIFKTYLIKSIIFIHWPARKNILSI